MPLLSAKVAKNFVQKWPELATKLVCGAIVNTKLVETLKEAMKEMVWKQPEKFLKKTKILEIYLKKPEPRSVYLANLWQTDDIFFMLKSLSMTKKVKPLEC